MELITTYICKKGDIGVHDNMFGGLLLGLIDDVKKISYKYKFLILIIIFFLFISLSSSLQINKIYFSTFNKEYYLNYLSIPFTILCLLLL